VSISYFVMNSYRRYSIKDTGLMRGFGQSLVVALSWEYFEAILATEELSCCVVVNLVLL